MKHINVNYDAIIDEMADAGYPYNDVIIDIFAEFENLHIKNCSFYYKENDEFVLGKIDFVLSFNSKKPYNVFTGLDVVEELEDEFYPFAIDEQGNYIGLCITNLEEEKVCLYKKETNSIFVLLDEYNNELKLQDIYNQL